MNRADAERRGRRAEGLCVIWLRLTGWRVLSRRLKAKAGSGLGEIDIVAKRGRVIAFIEVKARDNRTAGLEAVTALQQARIARSAEVFAARRADYAECQLRFDVMIVGQGLIPYRVTDAWRPG